MNWYYAKNGNQNGPLPTEDMVDRIAMGEISPTDLAWCEGMADWTPVGEIPQLKVETPVKKETFFPPAESVAPAPSQSPSPYQAPVTTSAPPQSYSPPIPGQPPSQGLAIGSMICGILGLLGCCVWFLSGPLAIVAIVLGFIALGKVKSNPAAFGGKGMATTGIITGFLGLLATAIIVGFSLWVATLSPEQMEETIMKYVPEAQRQEIRDKMKEAREQAAPPTPVE